MKTISEFKSQANHEKIKLSNISGEIWNFKGYQIIKLNSDLESYWIPNNNIPVNVEKFLSSVNWAIKN